MTTRLRALLRRGLPLMLLVGCAALVGGCPPTKPPRRRPAPRAVTPPQPKPPRKAVHAKHEHAHLHPHGAGEQHHHPHPHPHMAGSDGHHHPY